LLRETDLSQTPRQTQWITYSQRPKSPNQIKDNFDTWTVHDKHATHHLSLAVDARDPQGRYEPVLLDTRQSDNLGGRRQGISGERMGA